MEPHSFLRSHPIEALSESYIGIAKTNDDTQAPIKTVVLEYFEKMWKKPKYGFEMDRSSLAEPYFVIQFKNPF